MHRVLDILELREMIVSFVDRSTLLPFARTCTLFTESAVQHLYEDTSIDSFKVEHLIKSTLVSPSMPSHYYYLLNLSLFKPPNAGSEVLSAKDCEGFLRVSRRVLSVDRIEVTELSNLPRIISRDSPILFPNLRSLTLGFQVDQVWYPAIAAYLPATLQHLSVQIIYEQEPVTIPQESLCTQQQHDLLRFLAQRPQNESFSLSTLSFKRFDSPLDDETSTYLSRFIRTQHDLRHLLLSHVPSDLWPYIASLQNLKVLLLDNYSFPSGRNVEHVSIDKISQLIVDVGHAWENPSKQVTGIIFTNLESIFIDGPIDYLASLAKAAQGSKLSWAKIVVRGPWNLSAIHNLLSSLPSGASMKSLMSFTWSMSGTRSNPAPFRAFQPILTYSFLSFLRVHCEGSGGGVDLDDDDVALLVEALPNLEDIFFGPSFNLPRVTLYGLSHFTKCPKLYETRISFRPILPSGIQIPSSSSKAKDITQFMIPNSFREDELVVEDVVEFLDAVFPDLKSLDCPSGHIIWPALLGYRLKKASGVLGIHE
ncbi:hypothetical protein DL96DRAFT_1595323 [Flagelloscypha sp. PMI_526]|nr:hypothetical protein DL96DRAFT_1595323 [Flagelloscypha sp. PMI_526]